jgi:hypothetical protein
MNTNFEFSDFIENVNFNNTHSILDEIKYLVKKISSIEKKCKNVISQAKEEFPGEFQSQSRQNNTKANNRNSKDKENRAKTKTKTETKYNNKLIPTDGDSEQTNSPINNTEARNIKNKGSVPNGGREEGGKGEGQREEGGEWREETVNEKDNLDTILKKLIERMYKRIALKYHPDKCGDKYRSVFISATEAMEEKNLTKLLYIFALQEIKMEFTDEEQTYIETIKNQLDRKLSMAMSSPLSKWEILPKILRHRLAKNLSKMM